MDFILNSADHVLREEFGRSLSDEGVHVLDPFTGTGIFLVRLLQSALIADPDLERKYGQELHANEIVLLAYYIAAHSYRGSLPRPAGNGRPLPALRGHRPDRHVQSAYRPDRLPPGIGFPTTASAPNANSACPIQVVIGNSPWSAAQRSSADDNPNVDYPELEKRVSETYAIRSTATLKNSLYDTYKMAIRWASDRR